jgi:hypothetical protein
MQSNIGRWLRNTIALPACAGHPNLANSTCAWKQNSGPLRTIRNARSTRRIIRSTRASCRSPSKRILNSFERAEPPPSAKRSAPPATSMTAATGPQRSSTMPGREAGEVAPPRAQSSDAGSHPFRARHQPRTTERSLLGRSFLLARAAVGEGVMFCPRAGCGKSASPVRSYSAPRLRQRVPRRRPTEDTRQPAKRTGESA